VFYTAMGHSEETWRSPRFQEMIFNGIDWALGRKKGDVTPNLATAAPRAAELPPVSAPVAGLPPGPKSQEGQTPNHTYP
jgi:hypothetical protein